MKTSLTLEHLGLWADAIQLHAEFYHRKLGRPPPPKHFGQQTLSRFLSMNSVTLAQ